LISAGVSGPALLVFMLRAVQRYTDLEVRESVFDYFKYLLRVMMPINLFLLFCEMFGEFYTGSLHSASATYLYFGLHGHNMLTKFIWTATAFNVTACTIFVVPALRENNRVFYIGCFLAATGIWIEKGMGLIFPGFIPTPLGEIVEYRPNATEIFVNLGVVAFGAMLLTVFTKVTVAIQTGRLSIEGVEYPRPSSGRPSLRSEPAE
jgi:molybdopterin-containing oxidoreductase family membrane subunit